MAVTGMNVASVEGLPLSTRMQALLAHLVFAIDIGGALISEAIEASIPEGSYCPRTCAGCNGLGFVMTPIDDDEEDDDDNANANANANDTEPVPADAEEDEDYSDMPPLAPVTPNAPDRVYNYDYALERQGNTSAFIPLTSLSPTTSTLTPETVKAAVLTAMAAAPASATPVAVAMADGPAVTAATPSSSQVASTASTAAADPSIGVTQPVVASQPVVVAAQPVAVAPQPAQPVVAPQPIVASQPVVAPQPIVAPQPVIVAQPIVNTASTFAAAPPPLPTSVPDPSPLIPGFNPLGEHTPVPRPEDAVFAGPEDGPFYTITRGIRVGVFGGWETVSPYVTGVGKSVYRKHPTLLVAYTAYFTAFHYRQSVKYM